METSCLQQAFEEIYMQSPAPIQKDVERGSISHQSHESLSSLNNSINEMLERTVECNPQTNVQAIKDNHNNNNMTAPYQKLYQWIIKPIPSSFGIGICLDGKRSLEDEEFWHSGMITTRYSSTLIGTSSGSRYELNGEIHIGDAIDFGVPEALALEFKYGFPVNWEELLNQYLHSDIEYVDNMNADHNTDHPNLLEITNFVSQKTVRPTFDHQTEENTDLGLINDPVTNDIVSPNENGVTSDRDNIVDELCTEQESVTSNLLNHTMVDKVLVDQNENLLQKQKTRSNQSVEKNNNGIDLDTQEKTPYSHRQKRFTSTEDESDIGVEVENERDRNNSRSLDIDEPYETAGTKQIDKEIQLISTRNMKKGMGKHICHRVMDDSKNTIKPRSKPKEIQKINKRSIANTNRLVERNNTDVEMNSCSDEEVLQPKSNAKSKALPKTKPQELPKVNKRSIANTKRSDVEMNSCSDEDLQAIKPKSKAIPKQLPKTKPKELSKINKHSITNAKRSVVRNNTDMEMNSCSDEEDLETIEPKSKARPKPKEMPKTKPKSSIANNKRLPERNNTDVEMNSCSEEEDLEAIKPKSKALPKTKPKSLIAINKRLPERNNTDVEMNSCSEEEDLEAIKPKSKALPKTKPKSSIANNKRLPERNNTDVEMNSCLEEEDLEAIKPKPKARSKAKPKDVELTEDFTDASKPIISLQEWIIRPLVKTRKVIVEGKKKGLDLYWRSSSIAERLDQKTVVTDSGSKYKLIGTIEKLDSIDSGFSPSIVKSFTMGFPKNWKELIKKHFEINTTRKVKQQPDQDVNLSIAGIDFSRSSSKATEEDILNGTVISTPNGQFIDINNLHRTRSGRLVKPNLANFGGGQKIVYDPETKKMKVEYRSKFGEDYFTKQSIMMSAKSTRSRCVKTVIGKQKPVKDMKGMNTNKTKIVEKKQLTASQPTKVNEATKHNQKTRSVVNTPETFTITDSQSDSDNDDLEKGVTKVLDKSRNTRLQREKVNRKTKTTRVPITNNTEDEISSPTRITNTRQRLKNLQSKSEISKIKNNTAVRNRKIASANLEQSSESDQEIQFKTKLKSPSGKSMKKKQNLPPKSHLKRKSVESDSDSDSYTEIQEPLPNKVSKQSKKTVPKKHFLSPNDYGTNVVIQNKKISLKKLSNKKSNPTNSDNQDVLNRVSSSDSISDTQNHQQLVLRPPRQQKMSKKTAQAKKGKTQSVKQSVHSKKTDISLPRSKQFENVSHSEDEMTEPEEWGKSEIVRLERALRCITQYDDKMWKRIAVAVETRSILECQEFVESNEKYFSLLQEIQCSKKKQPVQITAKKGTLKRRQQIREFLEQEGEDQDLFDSTPYRSKVKKVTAAKLDDDVFSTTVEFPITPGAANYRTPSMKFYQTQFSAKKTPADYIASPAVNGINTVKADKVVYRYLKRRKLNKGKPVVTKKSTESPKFNSNKPRTLFSCDNVADIFEEDIEDDDDDDDEQDHYMSDA